MRLATIRTANGTRAARQTPNAFIELGYADVGELLTRADWPTYAAETAGAAHPLSVGLAPLVPRPGKILCVGLNYRTHILEMGRDLPAHPTLFAKFAEALIGPYDPVELAPESSCVDWEAELAVVIGRTVRRATEAQAAAAIAGFTVLNDVTMRDWQFRTKEWLQGKTFEATTPLGPVLVTPDELPGGVRPELPISCTVNDELMQKADTADLLFTPTDLVRYASTILTLRPGDVIATGTPSGVGHARTPARYLADGDVLSTEITGIGHLENLVRKI
ncbi:fumarylacetoacetate hydrolase family protein [Kribbella solani]|uniref:Acylpyruvate hydrolase n=1 Tax=Kribbella solani TaxID=236067 RepID=A0A841DLR9_9ACTN|nr:fumarylacetoacetate hydrolase family protein [Kribbella solani]MBB5980044.1 acylpyruvate hydrolase [Kribbella solani]MDX2972741.1 fumarylacetoacetate hydrolase family protein [Kribbella solani]MDX3005580.1 fumarylacetoacetate hydrolase family protein [Kribbella solani]